MPNAPSRLGPIESAIQQRDRDALYAALASRTFREANGCLRWRGARRPNGYGFVGRGPTNHLVHRLVAWAEAGFPGEIKAFPQVAHTCGTRDCLEPGHVGPGTAFLNALERSARTSLTKQNAALRTALRSLNPAHPLLALPEPTETSLFPRAGRSFETPAERVRKRGVSIQRQQASLEREQLRFRQVLDVRKLRASGLTAREALAEVGMHHRVFEQWEPRLEAFLREDENA